MFTLSEQRLCDQARAIRKNEWFTMVELEEIKRSVMNIDNERGVDNEGEINVEEAEESESEVTVEVRLVNIRCEEDNSMINELVDVMENGLDEDTRGLKKVDRGVVRQWTRKVNEVIKDIQTETITYTNRLIHAVSIYIAKVGLRTWWKRKDKGLN